jgi:hypothetical protein
MVQNRRLANKLQITFAIKAATAAEAEAVKTKVINTSASAITQRLVAAGVSGMVVASAPSATINSATVPTKFPTLAPTKAPTAAPSKTPTKAPTSAPTKAPTAAPTKPPTIRSDDKGKTGGGSSNIGAIAGGAGAGLVVVGILAYCYFLQNKKTQASKQKAVQFGATDEALQTVATHSYKV